MPAVASAYDTRPWRTSALVALAVLLAAHAALIVLVVSRLLSETPYNAVDVAKLRQVATSAALVLGALVLLDRRRPAQAVAIAVLILAVALFLPGTVLTVAWLLVDAWLLGDALLHRVQPATPDAAQPDAALATLAGLALIVGALSLSAQWRIHYAPVYATLLAAPLLFALRALPRYVERARGLLQEPSPLSLAERAWLALLGVVLVLHLFTAAKPEVGFDAHTMHLQFARLVAASHVWRYDVGRYAWAAMPLGADWMFAVAYVLGGEACVRLLNAAFGILAGWLVYRLARASAPRLPALVSVTLFASAPLAFLVAGLLYSETLWCAFVIGTLIAALDWLKTRSQATLCALCLLAAGALQAKAIAILWLVPLAVALMLASRGSALQLHGARARLVACASLLIGAWPYVNAWWRTGNPVFPFMNGVFRSPLFETARSFDNPLYHHPLLPWTPYQLVLDSGRFIEGATGAPGFHWLLLFPVIAIAFALRRRPRLQWFCVAIAATFFVAVYLQQTYLRYLLPALLVAAAAAAWALADLPDGRAARAIVAAAGVALVALNLRFMNTGSWTNAELCPTCAFDAQARNRYVAHYAPLAIVSEWLNTNLPDARVGFFTLQDPSPAGYTGYSRSLHWHDPAVSAAFARARDADDILAIARAWKLTHVVVHVVPLRYEQALADFRDRYTKPVWQFENYRVAAIVPPSAAPGDTVSAR